MSLAERRATMAQDPFDLAIAQHRRGDLACAESAYAAILASRPRHAGALMGLGLIAHVRNDSTKALLLLEEARRIEPRNPAILNNLGLALSAAGREDEALAAWRRALTIEPTFADALVNVANADARAGRSEAAVMRYRAALAADPRSAAAAANLGGLLVARRAYSEAVHWLEHAAALDPTNADIRVNLGRAWSECGMAHEARLAFGEAARLRPHDRPANSNLLLALHYCDDIGAEAIAEAHRAWALKLEPGGTAPRPPASPGRPRLFRVGLLSGDFNDHAVMRFLAPLLEHHDRARIELRCYYTGHREDTCTAEARAWSDAFLSVGAMNDGELTSLLRRDVLDILVDLSGHSAGGRPGVLALRPAPLQASWLGYLDTTGLAAVDFRISDRVCDPPGLTDGLHTERIWRLDTMWCYRPRADSPPPGPCPAQQSGRITFGSMNNPAKLSNSVLSLWVAILDEVPRSRILLHAHDDPLCRGRIAKIFAANAIAPERLVFAGRESASDYLRRFGDVDILLDTTPYSGGTTTCDAIWMGVPVVTLAGDRPFSRTSASVLSAAGFPQWIAGDGDGYVRIATSLAADIPALAAFRSSLRDKVAASRLRHERAMVEEFTAALPSMWAAAGLPPREGS